jgi:SOS-response transcriptional repressor LexA
MMSNNDKQRTMSDRLRLAMDKLNINQTTLARKINVKQQIIQYLCNSKTEVSRFSYKIAEALGISAEWLTTGHGKMLPSEDPCHKLFTEQKKVPLITFRKLKQYIKDGKSLQRIQSGNCVLTKTPMSNNSCALELDNQAMAPQFKIGTLIFIDMLQAPKNNDYVIAYLKNIDELLFRQFQNSNNNSVLVPLNNLAYKNILITTDVIISGVVKEARCYF